MNTLPKAVKSSVNAWNPAYLEDAYARFQKDPASLEPQLRAFFEGFDLALASPIGVKPSGDRPAGELSAAGTSSQSLLQTKVDSLIEAYRAHGHLAANLDALGRTRPRPALLTLEYHGLSQADLSQSVLSGAIRGMPDHATVGQIVEYLEATYCHATGIEFMHIQSSEEQNWWLEKYEKTQGRIELSRGQRAHILQKLLASEQFEKFLGKRYPGDKRFSLEGAESLIPMLDWMVEHASNLGADEIVLGMAHRGRLNVLNNVIGKTYAQIFTEFEENWDEDFVDGGGDVKYHRGYSGTRQFGNGKQVHLTLTSNPSHLESVGAVVEGRCRAKQRLGGDESRTRIVPVMIHGDAAISGQGIVMELLNLSQLEGYTTGGTTHIVVNNMIGFTTVPEDARSSRYCTDIAKMIEAPVIHVNGEDPEACAAAAQMAIEYRQTFKKDVFIDMWCYRRYGHNEQDEASFTQPVMASLIKRKPSVLKVYAERLLAEGVLDDKDMDTIRTSLDNALEQAQEAAKSSPYDPTIDPGSARWTGFEKDFRFDPVETAVSREMLEEVCKGLGHVPEGFKINPKLKRLLDARSKLLETKNISYADAESLAFGTLLLEGFAIRLSGQDSRRGTFSHRHAVYRDFETGEPYIPLNNMRPNWKPYEGDFDPATQQAHLCVYDSPLSEASVLGFDYGYSLVDPRMLVIWEGQFGDFVNGAQVIIDQYIASAQIKWDRWSGLVMLLPHGYEGAGPEHSSARMERFLELCANDNMQVCYPSTGPQVFHMLRRQMKRNFRKPLIVMTPKSMLRIPTGTIDELMTGSFEEIIDDRAFSQAGNDRRKVRKIVLCMGKFYHELAARREAIGRDDIALIRVEQLYPFHAERLRELLALYPKHTQIVWAQEEPRNAGAALFILDRLRETLGIDAAYEGRPASATPAVGSKRMHKVEQEGLLETIVGPLESKNSSADSTTKVHATAGKG